MDVYTIAHSSGFQVRLARPPLSCYHGLTNTIADLHGVYEYSGRRVGLLIRKKRIRDAVAWCLSQYRVQGYNPEENWDWITKNQQAVFKLFFKPVDSNIRGELYAFAIATPELEYDDPSDIPSTGDGYVDMLSQCVFQGNYSDAVTFTRTHSWQEISRLNWRMAKILGPKPNKQQKNYKKAQEDGSLAEHEYNLMLKRHEIMMENQQRLTDAES